MKLGLFVLRVIVGLLSVGHGTQKLFGWFGGAGPEDTGQFFESLGLRPGRAYALRAGAAEAGGGALLALGLLTPAAAAALTGVQTTAIRTVHWPKGPWVDNGGYEYNLTLIAAMLALAELGPGYPSLDRVLSIELSGPAVAVAAVGAGVAGSFLTAQPQPAPPEPAAPGQNSQGAPA